MNFTKADAARILYERREMRARLAPFVRKVFATVDPGAVYKHGWYIDYICEYLEAGYAGEYPQLIFNLPPRMLKSIIITIAFPAWVLGKDPSEQILCGSYGASLAKKHSVDCRLVIESDWYGHLFPETILTDDQNEKSKFVTTKRGHRVATSVGGSVLGDGGNVLILDDPIKADKANAVSAADRKAANDWIDQSWSTRKNDPKRALEIVVMQRLNIDDPTGHLLKDGGWELVKIPQEAKSKTIITFPRSGRIITREAGELLHESRIGPKEIAKIKKRLGTYGYGAQQQQDPSPLGGGRIKLDWFPRYKTIPKEFDELVISADTAQKAKEINDPTAIHIFGRVNKQWYWLHTIVERLIYPDLKSRLESLFLKVKPHAILIEDKSSGQSLIQEFKSQEFKLPIVAIEPDGDKPSRMDVQTPLLEVGMIALPDPKKINAPWLYDVEERLMHFPNPSAWDEIDALSQFLKWLRGCSTTDVEFW